MSSPLPSQRALFALKLKPRASGDEEPAVEPGWKPVPHGAIFGHPEALAEPAPPLPAETRPVPKAPATPRATSRRDISFSFQGVASRAAPGREATPARVLSGALARSEHAEVEEDAAIEAWLDSVEHHADPRVESLTEPLTEPSAPPRPSAPEASFLEAIFEAPGEQIEAPEEPEEPEEIKKPETPAPLMLEAHPVVEPSLEPALQEAVEEPEHIDEEEHVDEELAFIEPIAPIEEPQHVKEPEHVEERLEAPLQLERSPWIGSAARQIGRLVLGMALVFGLGSLVGAAAARALDESVERREGASAVTPADELIETMVLLPRERAMRQALRGAKTVVHLSSDQDFLAPPRPEAAITSLLKDDRAGAAALACAALWEEPTRRRPPLGARCAEAAIQAGRYASARRFAIDTHAMLSRGGALDEPALVAISALYDRAIVQDEALHPETLTLRQDVHLDVARALGGGKSISLKFELDGETRYAFKPSQLDWTLGWRAEVAADLLCQAIQCHFNVPSSAPSRISREAFEELYGRHRSTRQSDYAETFAEHLLWVREPGEDGVERDYLYGVLKAWMPSFVDFPLEYGDLWDGWLDASIEPSELDRDLSDALSALKYRQQGRYYAPILAERRGASTRSVARGLSDVLLFDYLTSNWDRYSGVETYYGVNNQFDEGAFLSLDNGAAFHVLTLSKVEQRFEPVTRFSRATISALRMIRPESLNDVLFPEPDADARQRLAVFWRQRDRLLKRVDALIEEHGEEAVLYFD